MPTGKEPILACLLCLLLAGCGGGAGQGNTPPTAVFTVAPASGTTSTIFHFDASGSSDSEDATAALEVRWDWESDGTPDTTWTTTKAADHQYSTNGVKNVTLEVRDTGGLTDTTSRIVNVSELAGPGQITFRAAGILWRINAEEDAVPENLSTQLDAIATHPGTHEGPITVSLDGAWYVFRSERFDADSLDWPGLTIAPADLSSAETIRADGQTIHGEGLAVATAGGTAVVYEDSGGPHSRDLFVVRHQGGVWTSPQLLTGQSPYAYNYWPVLSPDGERVAFDAADEPYVAPGTRICEVSLDGSAFRVLVRPEDAPQGVQFSYCHSPAYAPDGSVVFEAESQTGEQVWRLPAGGGTPTLVNSQQSNDNSPNVLPDGRIVSLWLNAPGSVGNHQIKVMDPDGVNVVVLTPSGIDVTDIGLGCGPLAP